MTSVYRADGDRGNIDLLCEYRVGADRLSHPEFGDTWSVPARERFDWGKWAAVARIPSGSSPSAAVLTGRLVSLINEYKRLVSRETILGLGLFALSEPEEELIPGVEYHVAIAYPPCPGVRLCGRIRSIRPGRTDLALSDEEWKALGLEDVFDGG